MKKINRVVNSLENLNRFHNKIERTIDMSGIAISTKKIRYSIILTSGGIPPDTGAVFAALSTNRVAII